MKERQLSLCQNIAQSSELVSKSHKLISHGGFPKGHYSQVGVVWPKSNSNWARQRVSCLSQKAAAARKALPEPTSSCSSLLGAELTPRNKNIELTNAQAAQA